MVQHINGELLCLPVRHVFAQPSGIEPHFIHSHQTNGGKMIFKAAQIPLGIGIQPSIQKLCDHFPLHMKGTGRNIHHMIQSRIKFFRRPGQISNPRHIDGHHANGTGALTRAEESAGFFAQFPKIQPQTAAHAAHIAGLHIAVHIIGKIRGAVFGSHFEQKPVVLRV